MRLFLDIDTREFLQSPSFPRALTTLALKRRDTDLIELQFVRDRTIQELPTGTTIRLGLKPDAAYTAEFLASGTFTKSGTGTATRYLLDLNLNTVALNAAFAAATPEPETLAAMLEVEWASGTTISSSLTLPATIANDVIRGDEGIATTANFLLRRANLPAPRIVFSGEQNINILGSNGNVDGTFQLINAPQAIAADLPQSLLDELPVFLELVIFKRRVSRRGAFAPPPWFVSSGAQVWQHPWPQDYPTRAGKHTVFNGTSSLPVLFNRPNHLPVTTARQSLPAWQTLHGRWRKRPVGYLPPTGMQTSITRIMPCGNRSTSVTENSGRGWSNVLAPFRCAWRFVAWHAESQSLLAGPLSPVVTIRPDKAPFFKTTTSGGDPAATVNANWTGAHLCSFFQ
jgi:hypothetical protein